MRARDLGLPAAGRTGPRNAITDVPGVCRRLHHADRGTRSAPASPRPARVRTRTSKVSCAAGWYSLNGNGEMTGTTCFTETGALRLRC